MDQPGIGTYFHPGVVSPLLEWGAKILDEAFAWYELLSCISQLVKRASRYLDAHVMDGYKFLMQYYRTGDKICLFGMLVLG